ncbi:hypothetical protein GN956_G4342 [Arapaima gigas]
MRTSSKTSRGRYIMGILPLSVGSICIVQVLLAGQHQCTSIQFSSQKPLYVALDQTLVLESKINTTGRSVSTVTWERQTEEPTNTRVRIAEFPSGTSSPDPRITVAVEGPYLRLRVTKFRKEDCGIYTVRVTDNDGNEESTQRTVREAEVVPKVSISLLCDVSSEREQWDSPAFQWLVDGEAVSNQTANLSADGRQLFPGGTRGRNYTCVVTSSQGRSIAQYMTSDVISGSKANVPMSVSLKNLDPVSPT